MAPHSLVTAPTGPAGPTNPTGDTDPDERMARQLIGAFPFVGQLWASAIREAGGGSIGRYKVLGILNGRGPTRAGELATHCVTSPSGMSELIEGLSADGYVSRVDDPTDRRAVVVALTDAGRAELDRVGDLMRGALVRQCAGLSSEQRSRLRRAVGDLTEILIDPSAKKEIRNVR